MSPRLLRHLFNVWPPFLLSGIHVTRLSNDWRHVEVELRLRPWNRNYVGTHFGGSLFAMTDPFCARHQPTAAAYCAGLTALWWTLGANSWPAFESRSMCA